MAEDREKHGHGESHHAAEASTEEGLMFPFLVVLAVALVLGWATQPGPQSTTTATAEPEAPTATVAAAAQPAAKPTPEPLPQPAAAPEPVAPAEEAAAPAGSAAPEPPAAPEPSAAPAESAAPEPSAPPAASAAPAAPQPAAAAGGSKFDRIAALTALGKNGRAAGRCRSGGAPAGNAKVIVTFTPDGHVSRARVLSPYVGTPTGKCILGHIRQTTIAPFSGDKPHNVMTSVHLY